MKIKTLLGKCLKIIGILIVILVFAFIGLMWWGERAMSEPLAETMEGINGPSWADYSSEVIQLGSGPVHFVDERRDSLSPMLLFVHGSPGSFDNFLPYFKDSTLHRHYRLASYDRPAYGDRLNTDPKPSLTQQADVLAELISYSRSEKVVLMGHSYGCSVIVELTSRYPKLVEQAVLIAAPVDPAFEKGLFWRRIANLSFIRWIMPESFRVSNMELTTLKDDLINLAPRIPGIKTPTLLVQGSKDRLVPAANAEYMIRYFAQDVLRVQMLEGKNHFILWSEADLISDYLLNLPLIQVEDQADDSEY